MENLESNGQFNATATTAKTEVTTADYDGNGVSAASEPLMMESNSEPTTATPSVLFGGEEKVSGGKERLQEEKDKVKNVPNKKPDVASGCEEKLSDGEEDRLEDTPNKNMHGDNPKKNNATLGDADYALVSKGEENAKDEEENVENTPMGSGERVMEEEGKVESTPKKANKRKRRKKNTIPGDVGDTVASISRSEEKVGSTPKKANRRRRRKLKNTTQRGTGSVVSVVSGEKEMVAREEKGMNTPKEYNRLKRKKTMPVDDGDAAAVISGGEEKLEDEDKEIVKNNPKKAKRKRRGKGRKKSTILGDTGDAVATEADKPETSNVGKSSKRVKGMGMIFMCNSKTKKDCYLYKVFGLPANKKEMVEKIYEGMRLFLYDTDMKLLYGIYKAAGPGGYNIEHKAFKSAFPSQVRFTIMDDCPPLPEEKFKSAIKDNYYGKNKFNCELTTEQVKNLCELFHVMTKGSKPKRGGNVNKRGVPSSVDRDEKRRHSRDRVKLPKLHGDRFSTSQIDVYQREAYAPQPLPHTLPRPAYERGAYAPQLLPHTLPRPTYERGAYAPQQLSHTLPRPTYERGAYASTSLPQSLPPQLYAYEQPVQMGYYRRDAQRELHDHHLTYSELRERNGIEYQNHDALYQEPSSYRDPYYPAVQPGYHPPSY